MPRDTRRRRAGKLLAMRVGHALLLLAIGLTALYAAVTPQPVAAAFPGAWLAYLGDIATLDFGVVQDIHRPRWRELATWNVYIPDRRVSAIIGNRLPSTAFVLAWTLLISIGGGIVAGLVLDGGGSEGDPPGASVPSLVIRTLSVYILAELLVTLLNFSDRLFNFDWQTLLVDSTPIIFGLRTFPNIASVDGFLVATKWALIPAIAASTAVFPVVVRLTHAAQDQTRDSAATATTRRMGGVTADRPQRRRTVLIWFVEALPSFLVVAPVATLIAEVAVRNDTGLSRVAGAALLAGEPTLLAALFLLISGPAIIAFIVRDPVIYLLTGTHRQDPQSQDRFALPPPTDHLPPIRDGGSRLRPLLQPQPGGLATGIRANPGPALAWFAGALLLVTLQLGAVLDMLATLTGSPAIPRLPTLISWSTIPDGAYPTPTGTAGSLFGLPQWAAWSLRVLLAEIYLLTLLAWTWVGLRIRRVIYGEVTTPILGGALVGTLRGNRRLLVGGAIALFIVALGLFAPATAPAMADNPTASFDEQTVTYRHPATGEIQTVRRFVVAATQRPTGIDNGTAGPLEYGRFGRFHPIGILVEPEPALTGGRTRDAFFPFVMRLQQLLFTVALVVTASVAIAVIMVVLSAIHPRVEAAFTAGATALTLLALPIGVAAVRRTIGEAAFIRVSQTPALPPSPVNQATSWLDQSLVATHHLALALLLAAPLVLVARRYLHPEHHPTPSTVRNRLQTIAIPFLAYAHFIAAGAIVIILIERIFLAIDPSAIIFYDIGVSMNFIWIDTALWYRNTVPPAIQLTLAAALALIGDGLRSRVDPTSHTPAETDAGGDGT